MTPVFDDNVTVTLHCCCPVCGNKWDNKLTLPKSLADAFVQIEETILCDPCGDRREEERNRRIKEQAELEEMEAAKIPAEFRKWDESKGDKAAVDWVTGNKDGHLLLIGEVNTGKTRSMVKVLIDEMNSGKKVLFCDFTEFAENYAGAMQEGITVAKRYFSRILKGGYDVVVFDDLDKHRINETAGNLLYKIFNKLYSGDITSRMWFTMNHRGKEFLNQFENRDYGAAVVSRIARMMNDGRFNVKHIGDTAK